MSLPLSLQTNRQGPIGSLHAPRTWGVRCCVDLQNDVGAGRDYAPGSDVPGLRGLTVISGAEGTTATWCLRLGAVGRRNASRFGVVHTNVKTKLDWSTPPPLCACVCARAQRGAMPRSSARLNLDPAVLQITGGAGGQQAIRCGEGRWRGEAPGAWGGRYDDRRVGSVWYVTTHGELYDGSVLKAAAPVRMRPHDVLGVHVSWGSNRNDGRAPPLPVPRRPAPQVAPRRWRTPVAGVAGGARAAARPAGDPRCAPQVCPGPPFPTHPPDWA